MKKLTTLTAALMLALGLTSVGGQPAGASDPQIEVYVDIKPGGCPNSLNLGSRGVLPVAILGTDDFDVGDVDFGSVRLVGVAPLRSSFEDVATPFTGITTLDPNACHDLEGDGFLDLSLKFGTQEIVTALGALPACVLQLTLTGNLVDGTPIHGYDVMIVRGDDCL